MINDGKINPVEYLELTKKELTVTPNTTITTDTLGYYKLSVQDTNLFPGEKLELFINNTTSFIGTYNENLISPTTGDPIERIFTIYRTDNIGKTSINSTTTIWYFDTFRINKESCVPSIRDLFLYLPKPVQAIPTNTANDFSNSGRGGIISGIDYWKLKQVSQTFKYRTTNQQFNGECFCSLRCYKNTNAIGSSYPISIFFNGGYFIYFKVNYFNPGNTAGTSIYSIEICSSFFPATSGNFTLRFKEVHYDLGVNIQIFGQFTNPATMLGTVNVGIKDVKDLEEWNTTGGVNTDLTFNGANPANVLSCDGTLIYADKTNLKYIVKSGEVHTRKIEIAPNTDIINLTQGYYHYTTGTTGISNLPKVFTGTGTSTNYTDDFNLQIFSTATANYYTHLAILKDGRYIVGRTNGIFISWIELCPRDHTHNLDDITTNPGTDLGVDHNWIVSVDTRLTNLELTNNNSIWKSKTFANIGATPSTKLPGEVFMITNGADMLGNIVPMPMMWSGTTLIPIGAHYWKEATATIAGLMSPSMFNKINDNFLLRKQEGGISMWYNANSDWRGHTIQDWENTQDFAYRTTDPKTISPQITILQPKNNVFLGRDGRAGSFSFIGGNFIDAQNYTNNIGIGNYLLFSDNYQTILGNYNNNADSDNGSKLAFAIGNGTSTSDRKNILSIFKDNLIKVFGNIVYNGKTGNDIPLGDGNWFQKDSIPDLATINQQINTIITEALQPYIEQLSANVSEFDVIKFIFWNNTIPDKYVYNSIITNEQLMSLKQLILIVNIFTDLPATGIENALAFVNERAAIFALFKDPNSTSMLWCNNSPIINYLLTTNPNITITNGLVGDILPSTYGAPANQMVIYRYNGTSWVLLFGTGLPEDL
jgi:hypothetical protein